MTTPHFTVRHDPKQKGGFPSPITFPATGKVFDSLQWQDRLFHRDLGSFSLSGDPEAKVELASRGPLATAVRVRARYLQGGKAPASQPEAVYDWLYLADRPLVLVRARMTQRERFVWPEIHFLELNYPREAFGRWAGGEPLEQGEFQATKKSLPLSQWGAIQMFGRAYGGGETKDLALRMKAGQQLVFGEQIGWIAPGVIREKDNAAFLRQVVRLRHALRRYFYAGQMARPPEPEGRIPTVTADWQWSGHWPVSTPALMTGAWQLPRDSRLVLLFVNVGDEPLTAKLAFDAAAYDLPPKNVRVARLTADDSGETFTAPAAFHRELSFPARAAWAWEVFSAEK